MENLNESFVQFPSVKTAKPEDRVEIHNKRIVPKREEINTRREHQENEWQQEYFIIYNSYILEDKEVEE